MAISIQQSWELSGEDFKTRGNELIGWVYFRWVVSQSFSRNHLEWCCPSSGGAAGQTDKGCDPHWAHLSSLSPTEGTESLQITIFSFKWVFVLGRKSLLSFVLASSFLKKKKKAGRWEHVWEHNKGCPASSENTLPNLRPPLLWEYIIFKKS